MDNHPTLDGRFPGDAPDAPDDELGHVGEEDGPIGLRVGRNPGNLGDEVLDQGDITHPDPIGETPQM